MTTTDRTRRHAVAAMTFATGVIIANNYYAQPLEAAIAEAFHSSSAAVGAVLTTIQLSYALGLALLVPLGDLLERRRLVVTMLTITALGQVGVALSPALAVLASAAAVVALTSVAAQILVPFAAHLARDGEQGKTISTVMSGLLVGVLLSRVVAGAVAQVLGWRAVFVLGAALTAVAVIALWRALPVLPLATRLATRRCCAPCSPSCSTSPCCAGGSSTARRRTRRSAPSGRASGSCSPGRRTTSPRA